MAWLAILIAAGIGYAVTIGLKGHMEKEPDKGPKLVPPIDRDAACMAAFDKLPTGAGPETDVRAAAKVAYLYATPGSADQVEILANHCTSIGHPEAGACLRQKANDLRAGSAGSPTTAPMFAAPGGYMALPKPIFPTDTESVGSGIAPDTGLGGEG